MKKKAKWFKLRNNFTNVDIGYLFDLDEEKISSQIRTPNNGKTIIKEESYIMDLLFALWKQCAVGRCILMLSEYNQERDRLIVDKGQLKMKNIFVELT